MDNIFTERLWRSVKYENVYLNDCADLDEAEGGLTDFNCIFMYKRRKKFIIFFIFISVFLLSSYSHATGLIAPSNKTIQEFGQEALIIYDNKQEDIILKVNYMSKDERFIWIIPVPNYPKVEKMGNNNIFDELAKLTNDFSWPIINPYNKFNTKIFSSSEMPSLEKMFIAKGYKITPKQRKNLNWYANKKWFFVIVEVEYDDLVRYGIKILKEIDKSVTKDNFAEKLASLYVLSLKNKDDKITKKIDTIFMLIPIPRLNEISRVYMHNKGYTINNMTEQDWKKYKEAIKWVCEDELKSKAKLEKINNSSLFNILGSIKISFPSNQIIYPIKISQISLNNLNSKGLIKAEEIILYVLADKQVIAHGFKSEYNQYIDQTQLDKETKEFSDLRKIISKPYFMTKLRGIFRVDKMDDDIYLNFNDKYNKLSPSELLARGRDSKRIKDIRNIQGALELFFRDHNKYCEKISFGSNIESEDDLKDLLGNKFIYMKLVPQNPTPGGINYIYETDKDKKNYRLKFKLELGRTNIGNGLCIATSDKVECSDKNISLTLNKPLSQIYKDNNKYLNKKYEF